MRSLLCQAFAAAIGFCTASAALAADIPAKAPLTGPTAKIHDWSGPYFGIQGGGAWGTSRHSVTGLPDFSGDFDVSGALGGITAGYNWQTGAVVIGVEGDASFAAVKGSTQGVAPAFCPDGSPAADCTTKLRGLETLRLRVGYAWDRILPYVTAGLAVGQIYGAADPGHANSGSKTEAGWTVGAGVEGAIADRWTLKVEYLYVDFGTVDTLFVRQPGGFPFNVSLKANIARIGLNYRF